MSKEYKELIVGLDIGTSKITCVVAELKPDGRMEVVGLGSQPSSGLKKGVVVNIEATVDAISRVIKVGSVLRSSRGVPCRNTACFWWNVLFSSRYRMPSGIFSSNSIAFCIAATLFFAS